MIPLGAGVGRILETSRFLEEIRTYTPMGRGISWEEGWECSAFLPLFKSEM